MRPLEIKETIRACIRADIPAFLWGAPGIGKSDIIRQIAAEDGFDLFDFRLIYREAIDLMGLPMVIDGVTRYAQPAALPIGIRAGKPVLLFLDELNNAVAQTQAAAFQVVLERQIAEHRLDPRTRLVAAGNRANDRGVVHRMPDPLVDRFIHIPCDVSPDDWYIWAYAHDIAPEVIAYYKHRPAHLHNHDHERKCVAFATPRGAADVSRIRKMRLPAEIESAMIAGRVGDGVASEMVSFFKLVDGMVSPDEVIANPGKAMVPQDVALLYAMAEALARRATEKTWGAVLKYARRMPKEYAQCLVSSAVKITPALNATPEYVAWCSENR